MQELSYYERVTDLGKVPIGEYTLKAIDANFISLTHWSVDVKDSKVDLNGWKFHISLEENDLNIKIVMEALLPILMENHVLVTKFKKVGRALDMDSHPCEHGRQITIYTTIDDGKDWGALLNSITLILVRLGIHPGYHNIVSKRVHGSHYISYRHDLNSEGVYVSCRDVYIDVKAENQYNPRQDPDRFDGLFIDVPDQLEQPIAQQFEQEIVLDDVVDANDCCCHGC